MKLINVACPLLCLSIMASPHCAVASGRLIEKSDLTYLGAFRVPQGQIGGFGTGTSFTGGDTRQPMAYNPAKNSIIMFGYPNDKKILEISIPALVRSSSLSGLNMATVLQMPIDPANGNWSNLLADGSPVSPEAVGMPGGLLVYKGKLIGSSWSYYDASGMNGWRSHFTAPLDWTTSAYRSDRLYPVGKNLLNQNMANGGFVGGYMTPIPKEWQARLGGTVLTGMAKMPIVSRSSLGPSIWSFDPDTLSDATPANALVTYPVEHPTLGTYSDAPSPYYNRAGGYGGIVFPDGTDSVLIIGDHGLGIELDANGVPVVNSSRCTGAGTSNRGEVQSNESLKTNASNGWTCGSTFMTPQAISSGDACCLDPANTAATGIHSYPYVVGTGQSCYGLGTSDLSQVRSNAWLRRWTAANPSTNWPCGTGSTNPAAISEGDGCCFDMTASGSDKGGKSYPYVYQIWRYDANDLANVKSGAINPATSKPYQPWEVMPTVFNFDLPFASSEKIIVGATYDPVKRIIYMAQKFGDGKLPVIHAFQLPVVNAVQNLKAIRVQ